ncbi:MAG TPA: signal peptidase II [Longimicrobiales bacterium]
MEKETGIERSAAPGLLQSVNTSKAVLFLAIMAVVVFVDYFTKRLVQENFHLYQQVEVIGEYLRLTFIYNPGAAFGIHIGPYSRSIFLVLSVVALVALAAMYWATPGHDRVRLIAISLVCAGAVGNLVDRVRSHRGVVDFLDVGVGDLRWPVFNVADIAVTTGAVFLALSLWREERQDEGDG